MFLLTLKDQGSDGAYAIQNRYGEKVLMMFQKEDDAERYAMMLEEQEYPEIKIMEVDGDLMVKTCQLHGYRYTIITSNDIVIPPELTK